MIRLSESLRGIGRPLFFYPSISRFFDSLPAGVFLCYLAQWQDDKASPVFRTGEEIEDDLGLTRWQQEEARKTPRRKGYLEERRDGIPARLFYWINWEKLDADFGAWIALKTDNLDCESTAIKSASLPQTNNQPSADNIGYKERKEESKLPGPPLLGGLDFKQTDSPAETGHNNGQALPEKMPTSVSESLFLMPAKGLVTSLVSMMKQNDPRARLPANLTKWVVAAEALLRIDKRPPEEAAQVLDFSQRDSFWRANILSMTKFREKYPTLLLQMQRTGFRPPSGSHSQPGAGSKYHREGK